MNNWVIILVSVWGFGALACLFSKSGEPFALACQVSLFIGLAYLIMH